MIIEVPESFPFVVKNSNIPSKIHLHLAQPESINLLDSKVMDENEHKRANSFKFANDRNLYIASHIFLRQVLSSHAALEPNAWQFIFNAYGKPSIANSGYRGIQFNLSHTRGLITCVISHNQSIAELGVDVEEYHPLTDLTALCHYAFSSKEGNHVLSTNNSEVQKKRFFTYWTLKEAYIKARGLGLSIPLQQFALHKGENQEWQVSCEPELQDDVKLWQFITFQVGSYHHSSIAIRMAAANNHTC